jgi:hypothetical protein
MYRALAVVLALAAGLSSSSVAMAQVRVNVNVAPPVVLASPPKLVIVPSSPVKYAPEVNANLFFHEGRYYSLHESRWLVASSHSGPWVVIETAKVPPPVIAVPVKYYKVPPGHAKKMSRSDEGGKDCPPGQAKKGRC